MSDRVLEAVNFIDIVILLRLHYDFIKSFEHSWVVWVLIPKLAQGFIQDGVVYDFVEAVGECASEKTYHD